MKRILSVLLILVLVLSFAGCSDNKGRILYNVNLTEYVELGNYKGIKVDKNSEDFDQSCMAYIISDIVSNNFQSTESVKEGTVNMGDIANIDFVGKKDGVAFEGGTSEGYDLTIGSGKFISGFEEGLVGKKVGSKVELNLTFPQDYGSEELAGQDVVFTVTINSVKPAKTPDQFYSALGFTSVEAYYESIEEKAVEDSLQQAILEKVKVKDYPQTDVDYLYEKCYTQWKNTITNTYQATEEQYLTAYNITKEQLKEDLINNQVKPIMDMQMVWYAIFDKEGMKLTEKDNEQAVKDIIATSGGTVSTKAEVIEVYGEYYIEVVAVSEKVFDFVEKNAKIS